MSKIVPHFVIMPTMWYVDCDIHTNSIESSWSPLERGMFGQFRSECRRHLQRYVDEFCYRLNQRHQVPEKAFFDTINRGLGEA